MLPFHQNARKKIAIDHIILYDSRRGMTMAIDNVCIRLHKIKFFVAGGERMGGKATSWIMGRMLCARCSHLWRIHIFRKNCVDIFSSVESYKSSVRYRTCTRSIQFPFAVLAHSVKTQSALKSHTSTQFLFRPLSEPGMHRWFTLHMLSCFFSFPFLSLLSF